MDVLHLQIGVILPDCLVLHNSFVCITFVFTLKSGFDQTPGIVFDPSIVPFHFFLPMPFGFVLAGGTPIKKFGDYRVPL